MTWKEKRIVTILGVILSLLAVALLLVFSMRYRAHRNEVDDAAMITTGGEIIDKSAFMELHFITEQAELNFSINAAGDWGWTDNPDFPLDDSVVQQVLAILEDPKPQQTLPMEGGPEAFALESPIATVTAVRGDGSKRRIDLGKSTTDGQSYYAMLDENLDTVYILRGELYHLMRTPIYAMCRPPQLPQLSGEALVSLSLQSGDAVLRLTQEQGRWMAESGEDVTENPKIQALLDDLAGLSIDKCLDFDPSDRAVEICGFTAPAAVLTADYLDESGAEQRFLLTVGQRVPEKTGRYVRLDGQEPIYFLPTELLDPLIPLASLGLN